MPGVETPEARAAHREEIAAKLNHERGLAIRACGLGALAYGKWTLHDRLKEEPNRVTYCARWEGQSGWQPPAPEEEERVWCTFTSMHTRPDKTTYKRMECFPIVRWELTWGGCEAYHPKTAKQLESLAETRKVNKAAKELAMLREEMPLFADQLEGEWQQP